VSIAEGCGQLLALCFSDVQQPRWPMEETTHNIYTINETKIEA